jgi:ribosomal protein L17
VGLKAPLGLGEASFSLAEDAPSRDADLASIVKYIDRSASPKSYLDEDLEPGDWIKFEAWLSYKFRRWSEQKSILMFWEPKSSTANTRLLLHGSPNHLIGSSAVPETDFSFSSGQGFAEWLIEVAEGISRGDERAFKAAAEPSPVLDLAKYAGQVLRDLDRGLPSQRAANDSLELQLKRSETAERFIDRVAERMASYMGGYARVTIVLDLDSKFDKARLVVASPLFVERRRRP